MTVESDVFWVWFEKLKEEFGRGEKTELTVVVGM